MYAGLKFDKEFMKSVADQKVSHAQLFLSHSRSPRRLFLKCVSDAADASKTDLTLKLDKAREDKVFSKKGRVRGRPVTWKTWRQFNAVADSKRRKQVYDELVRKVPSITPIIRGMFQRSWTFHKRYGTSPLRVYLESERIRLDELKGLVRRLGSAVRKPFQEALRKYSREIKKDPAEYYDDFYYFRGKVYQPLNKVFARFDPAVMPVRQLRRLGFDTKRISLDTEDRPGKTPSPIAFFVQIPNDARLLLKPVSPYTDLEGSYHEFGHAMHCTSIDPQLPLWDREFLAHGLTEVFSTFLESLLEDARYLRKFGLNNDQVMDALERRRFMELYFVAFYSANSLMKIVFQEKKLTMEKASRLYALLYKEFVGFDIPGEYWQLHHVMPDYDLYSPSYLIAAVRKAELIEKLRSKYGNEWWDSAKTGSYLRELMNPGANIAIDEFSKLDTRPFLKGILSEG